MKNIMLWIGLISFLHAANLLCQSDKIHLITSLPGANNAVGLGDVNGDGYDDFMIKAGDAKLYFGGESFIEGNCLVFESSATEFLGMNFSGIGDINNDGYDDFAIRGEIATPDMEHRYFVHIFYGASTIDKTPVVTLRKNPYLFDEMFGEQILPAGDFNGDGYDDFLIGSWYNWSDGYGRVYLYLGSEAVTQDSYILFYSGIIDDSYGSTVGGVGDINNDGYDDFMVSDWLMRGMSGFPGEDHVYIYYGNAEGDNEVDNIISSGETNFGRYIQRAGDIDNDGNKDFIISSLDNVHIFNDLGEIKTLNGYGYITAGDGNINNDEYNDFLVGGITQLNSENIPVAAAWAFYGNPNFNTDINTRFESNELDGFGAYLSFLGDLNNDGYDEFAISAPSKNNNTGITYIYSAGNLTGIKENFSVPTETQLFQNYPNPFNPSTKIQFSIPVAGKYAMKIYNILGQEVAELLNEQMNPGKYTFDFNARGLASGIYFYRLIGDNKVNITKKMILLR